MREGNYGLNEQEEADLRAAYTQSLRWAPERSWDEYLAGRIAPVGQIWVCCACGKKSRDRYGSQGGWDESCMLNSFLQLTGASQ